MRNKSPRTLRGRPKLPSEQKKTKLSITLSSSTMQLIDDLRGETPRSEFIDKAVGKADLTRIEEIRAAQKDNGVFYTPRSLSKFVARKAFENYTQTNTTHNISELIVLDPACGDGELLAALQEEIHSTISQESNVKYYGTDISKTAAWEAKSRLEFTKKSFETVAISVANSLTAPLLDSRNKPDIIIANPPWGANISTYKTNIKHPFRTMNGQYDSSDLFVELGLSLVKTGGIIAYILPDSIFSQDKICLRKLLLSKTCILYIGRLGEKIFKGVNRACTIIICQNKIPQETHRIQVFRLDPSSRSKVLDNSEKLDSIDKANCYTIRQSRFTTNAHFRFDIDLCEEDEHLFSKININNGRFGDYLSSSRGIELSKHGKVYCCPECKKWLPLPRDIEKYCPHCKALISIIKNKAMQITSNIKKEGYKKLLTGESISRYNLSKPIWIDSSKNGIKYKKVSLYLEDKIVVRKTGVGISASIDYSGAFTTQVVYILKTKKRKKFKIPLEVFIAILNSRAIYYYLVKSYGETEWRSHPYLTQTILMNIPIPSTKILLSTSRDIVALVKKIVIEKSDSKLIDAKLERLIAKMFNLTHRDYIKIYDTINRVQDLLPIRALKKIQPEDIFSIKV